MPRTLAGNLAQALFTGMPNRSRRVAVFSAYSDESASADRSGIFLVGGYVGAAIETWPYVVDAWQERVLDAFPKIPYLHMVEIRRQRFKNKYGLSDQQAQDKVDTAIDILVASGGLKGFFSKINIPDLEAILCQPVKVRGVTPEVSLKDPDYICYLGYAFHMLVEVRDHFPEAESVDFIVSRKSNVTNHIKRFHEELRQGLSNLQPDLERLVGRLIPDDMNRSPGLQAADVMCWYVRKYIDGEALPDNNLARLQLRSARYGIGGHQTTPDDLAALYRGTMKVLGINDENEIGND